MPTKRRDIIRKVRHFGGWEDEGRGKDGHRLLMRRDPEMPTRTLSYPLQFHGSNADSRTASSARSGASSS